MLGNINGFLPTSPIKIGGITMLWGGRQGLVRNASLEEMASRFEMRGRRVLWRAQGGTRRHQHRERQAATIQQQEMEMEMEIGERERRRGMREGGML